MRTSDSIAKLAPSLIRALGTVQNALKDSTNPHFRSDYASLASVLDTAKPALAAEGIAVIQGPGWEGDQVTLTTRFLHDSGEWIESTAGSPASKMDPQGVGSAITYLRRYSLAAMAGITQEDDDGSAASNRSHATGQPREAPAPERREPSAPAPSGDGEACPKCGGALWDNRATKKGKQPDYKCKSKECDYALWLDGAHKALRESLDALAITGKIKPEAVAHTMEGVESGDLATLRMAQEWVQSKGRGE